MNSAIRVAIYAFTIDQILSFPWRGTGVYRLVLKLITATPKKIVRFTILL